MTTKKWLAHWDAGRGAEELSRLAGRLAGVSYFAAAFKAGDPHDALFVPAPLLAARAQAAPGQPPAYLTLVNDVIDEDGGGLEKDLGVLRRVLAPGRVTAHVAEAVALAREGGYQGLEVDYERWWKDGSLPGPFLAFLAQLWPAARAAGLDMRVVLEPSAPMDAGYPEGPEYTVMLYNLHGTHNGPGPKANRDFIRRVVAKMAALPGRRAVALATGGCLWSREAGAGGDFGRGQKTLTEGEAEALRQAHGAIARRQRASGALRFVYAENGREFEAWYADGRTLRKWAAWAAQEGVTSVMIWRLGGNVGQLGLD